MKPKRLKSKNFAPQRGTPASLKPPPEKEGTLAKARKRWFRLTAVLSPVLLLALIEVGLRMAGAGYPSAFFLRARENGRAVLIENSKFGWRFFPPAVARTPRPSSVDAKKPPDTIRVFVFGESAAMGDPEPTYGLPRQLERILQARHPDQRVEVVNVAMTAINSHVMRQIAKDCRRAEGDFWVIYAGNNEVVGPFGAGTVFGRQAPGIATVRLNLALKSTRLGQFASRVLQKAPEPAQWEGMELFLGHHVSRDDPRLKKVYANFSANLADVVRLGVKSGASVILTTVPVNLKDSPPFGSQHRPGLAPDQLAAWEQSFAAGLQAEKKGCFAEAVEAYGQAAGIDAEHAELLFRRATCKLQLGLTVTATADFKLARDLDSLRFRADSRLNQIIQKTAAGQGVPLVDAEVECARRALNGVPGEELFYDHVHLNFSGNFVVAAQVAAQMEKTWPGGSHGSIRTEIQEEEIARQLAFTDFDRLRIAKEMKARLRQPPFRSQSSFRERDERLERLLDTLKAPATQMVPLYETALARAPDDWMLHDNFARLLEAAGDGPRAAVQWQEVARLLPHSPAPWLNLGHLAHDQGRFAEAEQYFQEVLTRNPLSLEALNELGLLAEARGQTAVAMQRFNEALRLNPGASASRINLALALAHSGDTNGAIAQYQRVLRRDTNNVDARVNFGLLRAREGRMEEAMMLYTEALRLKPDHALAHLNFASLLVSQGRFAEAATHYEAVLRDRPQLAQGHLEFGMLLGRLGRDADALRHFGEAARLRPTQVDARFNYGIALAKNRRFAEAVEEFKQTLRLQPGHASAVKALEQASRAAAGK